MDLGASANAASDVAVLEIIAERDMVFKISELPLGVCFRDLYLLTHRAAYPVVNSQLREAFSITCLKALTSPAPAPFRA